MRWANGQESSGVCTGTTNWSTSITLIQGINLITVTAYDAAGNTGFDSLTVTYTPLETLPSVTITDPTTSSTYDATQSTLNISGTRIGRLRDYRGKMGKRPRGQWRLHRNHELERIGHYSV